MTMGWRIKLPVAGLSSVNAGSWVSINTPPAKLALVRLPFASRNWALMLFRPSPLEVVNNNWVRLFASGRNGCKLPKSLPSAMRYSMALRQPSSSNTLCWSKYGAGATSRTVGLSSGARPKKPSKLTPSGVTASPSPVGLARLSIGPLAWPHQLPVAWIAVPV